MIMSSIIGTLTSKEILSILGLGSATVVAALTQKFYKSRAFAGKRVSKVDLAVSLAIYLVVLVVLLGVSTTLLMDLFNIVETMFFM